MTLYDEFIFQVENNILLSNENVKKAVKRHLRDLKKAKTKKYPYEFSREKADRAIQIAKLFRHTSGSVGGEKFILKPYMAFVIASIYGWVNKKTGKRRFRRAYIEIARKGVKSELGAIIGLIGLFFSDDYAPQVYTIATEKEQAKIVFQKAVLMIKKLAEESPAIAQRYAILGGRRPDRIINYKNEGLMMPFSSESKKKDGFEPSVIICDEYHAHPTDEILNVMTSGSGPRPEPLTVIITTAGFNIESPCYEERKVCINVLDNVYINEEYFGIIWTLDDTDDWKDPKVWVKAAPNIGETPTWEFMNFEFSLALQGSSKEVEFKTKLLNIWNNSQATWIPDRQIKRIMKKIDLEQFAGRKCIGGLDLAYAAGGDIVAYQNLFLPTDEDPNYYSYPYYFVSEEKINDQKRTDKVNYRQWFDEGHLIKVPGNIIDYTYVKNEIFASAEKFDLKAIAADRFNTSQLIVDIVDAGITVIPYAGTTTYMNTPVDDVEMLVKSRKLILHDNPVTRWMFRNCQLFYDSNGLKRIMKYQNKKPKKVDGVIALLMAMGASRDKKIINSTYQGQGPQAL